VRIVLFGYGEMGCTGLEFLLAQREDVAAVITHRDDPNEKRWYRSLAEVTAAAKIPLIYGEETDLKEAVGRLHHVVERHARLLLALHERPVDRRPATQPR